MKSIMIVLLCMVTGGACVAQNVVQGEYFVDTDLGFGNNTLVNFTPSPDNIFTFNINLSGYTVGNHKLYFRTKDSGGKWGLTVRRNVEVVASESKITMAKGEYFIDTDPGFGMGTPITIASPDSIILQNFSAATTGLSEGLHKLYGRFLDNIGRWSLTFRRNVEIYKSDANKVLNGEYFFKTDGGFGSCDAITFAVPASDGSFLVNIPLSSIPAGADTLYVRLRDDVENRWSLTTINNISTVLPLTLLAFSATEHDGQALVTWQTADEVNTSYFKIERSLDGVHFTTIGTVGAKPGTGLQNDYQFNDATINATGQIYYRLQMVDKDGMFNYSKIVYVTITNAEQKLIVYPNPAHGYFVIRNFHAGDVAGSRFVVSDASGRQLIRQQLTDNTEKRVDITILPKGVYLLNIFTNGKPYTQKLIVE